MTIAYTIGAIRSYDQAVAEGQVHKLGRSPEYEGGWVWPSLESALSMVTRTDLGFVAGVYEIELPGEWERLTFLGRDGVHHITEDSLIIRKVWPLPEHTLEFAEVWMRIRDELAFRQMARLLTDVESRRLSAIDYVLDSLEPESKSIEKAAAILAEAGDRGKSLNAPSGRPARRGRPFGGSSRFG